MNLQKLSEKEISECMRFLAIDLTIDDSGTVDVKSQYWSQDDQSKVHLGFKACTLVKNYLNRYSGLKELILPLKKFLSLHDLDQPYRGGLSSYALFTMVVAFMNFYGYYDSAVYGP